jgi:hypothetical protein
LNVGRKAARKLCDLLEERDYAANKVLFRAGDEGDAICDQPGPGPHHRQATDGRN